ncbi:MAG: transporter [Thermodesulfobacteriota bacterium]
MSACLGTWLPAAAVALGQDSPPGLKALATSGEENPADKQAGAPTTSGPLITDTCIPIEANHLQLQLTFVPTFYPGNFTSNWRRVSYGGNYFTYYMPLKITYCPLKNWETYVIIPYVQNWNSSPNTPGPNGETSATYAGIGDISWFTKYLLLEETDFQPAVSGLLGLGFPSGHASHLTPVFLGTDAVGTGSFAFTTGFNLYKYVKPLLLYGNIWLTTPVNLYQDRQDTVRSREYLTINLAAEYPLTTKWVALLEFFSIWTWTNISTPQGYQSPNTYVGVLPGIEYLLSDKWAFSAGAAFYLFGKQGSIQYMPTLSVYYNF